MSDENKPPLSDILPIMYEKEAKQKQCFLTGNTCGRSMCMAWKTVVEYDYTNDPKKEEPTFVKVPRTVYGSMYNDESIEWYIRQHDYTVVYDDVEIEWEKIKTGDGTVYRRIREEDDRLGYCMKLVE